jgi:hypothetical protein
VTAGSALFARVSLGVGRYLPVEPAKGDGLLRSGPPDWKAKRMSAPHGDDLPEVAVLDAGPMDGKEHPADWDTEQLCVIMADGQKHRYVRTGRVQVLADGRSASVFEYRGRFYGPKY